MDTSSALEPVCVYLPAQQQAGAHADMAAELPGRKMGQK